MENIFQQLNNEEVEHFPFREDFLENKLLRQAETFGTFGKVIELFLPNAFQAAVGIISSQPTRPSQHTDAPESPASYNPVWRQRMDIPQPPREGVEGRFRPSSGRD